MRVDYIQQGVVGRSEYANPQKLINFYPQLDKSGRAVLALYGTEGLVLEETMGDGPIRAVISKDSFSYWVSGNKFYRYSTAGVLLLIDTIATNTGFVSMSTNGTYILIIDFEGQKGYTYNINTSAFAQISDTDFPTRPSVTVVCTGYFLVNDATTQRVHYSTDPTTWAALDYFSAEKSPDDVISLIEDKNELILLGAKTVEIWKLSTTWVPISGSYIDYGCAAKGCPAKMDNSIYWLDENHVVRVLRGTTAQRVSNHAIEYRIRQHTLAEILAARAYCYTPEGHSFYVLTIGNETFVYDAAVQNPEAAWHQRAYLVPATGLLIQHRSICHIHFGKKNYVGDYENGKVYRLDPDAYTDNGDPIQASATYKPVIAEGKPIFFHRLETEVESGVGTQTGQGENPQIELGISYDGGRVWEPWDQRYIGAVGEYRTTCTWDGLGAGRNTVFELRITDPVKRVLTNTYIEVTAGM